MTTVMVEQLDAAIAQLSFTDQLWLVERLVHRLRTRTLPPLTITDHDLAAMATDPTMYHLIQQINDEFLVTEGDGLESRP